MTRDELQLLTIAELADLWNVSRRTIERLIKAGDLQVIEVVGVRRIRLVDAARYLEGLPNEQAT